jgi:ATP-dependent DNA ligase
MHGSIRSFQFGLPRDIKLPEAKTANRTAFIEPIQCKPVTALPAGEKRTFEIKLDGYRCIVVKRAREVTLFSRRKKVLNTGSSSVVEALASLGSDFVLDENLLPWIRKADLHFSSLRR